MSIAQLSHKNIIDHEVCMQFKSSYLIVLKKTTSVNNFIYDLLMIVEFKVGGHYRLIIIIPS